MNRIVIVGNGFDLAHGLKTRYEDFLVKLLVDKIIEASNNHKGFTSEVENLFHIKINADYGINYDRLIESSSIENLKHLDVSFNSKRKYLGSVEPKISVKSQSDFFNGLIKGRNWTDIESHYFKLLIDYVDDYSLLSRSKMIKDKEDARGTFFAKVEVLNSAFESLQECFINYIKRLDKGTFSNKSLENLLTERITTLDETLYKGFHETEKRIIKGIRGQKELQNVIFVNFNYTETILNYISSKNCMVGKTKLIEIPIHGKINNNSDKIIFGYGDDTDVRYKELERFEKEHLLKHFKSHYYQGQKHYSSLLYYLGQSEFEVFIMGHSLGLSDSLLLQTMFEHEKCRFIHLCHTGGDSHFRKRIAISRHFKDKKLMRSRLLEENPKLEFDRNPNPKE